MRPSSFSFRHVFIVFYSCFGLINTDKRQPSHDLYVSATSDQKTSSSANQDLLHSFHNPQGTHEEHESSWS